MTEVGRGGLGYDEVLYRLLNLYRAWSDAYQYYCTRFCRIFDEVASKYGSRCSKGPCTPTTVYFSTAPSHRMVADDVL